MGYFEDTSYGADGVWISGNITASDTAGAFLNWTNTEEISVIVDAILVDITTASSSACTVDIGQTDTSAATLSDNMLNGVSIAATGVKNHIVNKGTNGVCAVKVGAGEWITGSKASGATAGAVGKYYIHYRKVRTN